MAEDTYTDGRGKRIRDVDIRHPTPELRAQYIYAKISEMQPKPTIWDITCFCVEFMGMVSLMEPVFAEKSKELAAILYEAHYTHQTDLASCLPGHLSIPASEQSQTLQQSTIGATTESELMIEKSL